VNEKERCRLNRGKASVTGLVMAGVVPAIIGVVLSLPQALAEESTPFVPAPVTSAALVIKAQAARNAGDLVTARELLLSALQSDPTNASARSALASVDSQTNGHPVPYDGDPIPTNDVQLNGDIRQQAALAEANIQIGRAEFLAASKRFEDAIVLLAQAHVALSPYTEQVSVREKCQRIDGLLATYREQNLIGKDAAASDARIAARLTAEERRRVTARSATGLLNERMARVQDLESKNFIESALSACRKLVDDYPGNKTVEALYARLIKLSHVQRKLSIADQREELLQEIQERIERSLIPSGFDGRPSFPLDWEERHLGGGVLNAPIALEAWEEALNDKLATRLSFNLVEQNAVEALNAFAKQTAVNIIIDPTVFAAGDVPLTIKASGMTLRNTLSWICTLAGTQWSIERGAIYVGGKQESTPVLAVYDVTELLFVPTDQVGKLLWSSDSITNGYDRAAGGGGGGGGGAANLFAPPENASPARTPEDLVDTIKKSVSPTIWENAANAITIHRSTMLVTAPTSTHLLIQQFIRAQTHQSRLLVRVTARWVTIKDGFMEEIGVDWRSDVLSNPALVNPTPLQPTPVSPHLGVDPALNGYHRMTNQFDHSGSLVNSLPETSSLSSVPALASSGLNLQAMIINATQASAIVNAVERNLKGHVLEAPEVVTMNGVEGNTFMGRQFAYIGDYEAAAGSAALGGTLKPKVGMLGVGAVLDIKPYISSDGTRVRMEFRPAIVTLESLAIENIISAQVVTTGFDPNGVGIGELVLNNNPLELPNILVRSISTNIDVPDGATVLVGGFGRYIEQATSTGIPFLNHIPFIGRLFGKRGRYSDRYKLYMLADLQIINYAELEAKL
jgi:tetratricopeptide (TPR) repeat protein